MQWSKATTSPLGLPATKKYCSLPAKVLLYRSPTKPIPTSCTVNCTHVSNNLSTSFVCSSASLVHCLFQATLWSDALSEGCRTAAETIVTTTGLASQLSSRIPIRQSNEAVVKQYCMTRKFSEPKQSCEMHVEISPPDDMHRHPYFTSRERWRNLLARDVNKLLDQRWSTEHNYLCL